MGLNRRTPLGRRMMRLEEQEGVIRGPDPMREEHDKRQWLARARIARNEAMPEDVRHARGLIRLFRTQNILSEFRSAEELVERVVSWQPEPEGGRRRSTIEREVAWAVYRREPGTENMVCSPAWRESFVAGDSLGEGLGRAPDEAFVGIG